MDITKLYRIAISGKANTGKNTIANIIPSQLNKFVFIHAFADPIKEMVQAMFKYANYDCLYGASSRRNEIIPGTKLTYRQVLIDLGKLGRSYDFDHWVKEYDNRVHRSYQLTDQYETIICTDLRYRNEFDYLKKNDYYLIRVKRNNDPKDIINDSSETSQDEIADNDFDEIIDNNYSYIELEKQVNFIVEKVKKTQKIT